MKWICYIPLLACLVGCTKEQRQDPNPAGDRQVTFRLESAPVEETGRAPALDELNENKVTKVQVFFYEEEARECLFQPGPAQISLDPATREITVTLPSSSDDLFDRNLTIYVLANCDLAVSAAGKTLEEVQNTVYDDSPAFNPTLFAVQEDFLMDGKIENAVIPSDGEPSFPALKLQRAAAKVDVTISSAQLTGYEAVSAQIRLTNYLEKTTLGADAPLYKPQKSDYKKTEFRPLNLPAETRTGTGPFYSYANDWELDASAESYVTIAVLWRNTDTAEERTYYYRVRFNYRPDSPGDGKSFRLRRNYIYDLQVNLDRLGGIDPEEAVELDFMLTLKDWTEQKVEVVINQFDYLMVEERYVEMHNIMHYEIPYISSTRVNIVMDSVFHYKYETNGDITRVPYPTSSEFYPAVVADPVRHRITVDASVPVNYVPTRIFFTVQAGSNLKQQVNVMLFPRQYVTSHPSRYYSGCVGVGKYSDDVHPEGDPNTGQTNFNFYTITTTSLAPGDPYVLGDPTRRWLDYDTWIRETYNDGISNDIISPQFIIASQRGISLNDKNYRNAIDRCQQFWENDYPWGMWRVPTTAELLLVARLQRDDNSAIKGLFTALAADNRWWTARHEDISGTTRVRVYSVKVGVYGTDPANLLTVEEHRTGSAPGGSGYVGHAVRCVYDPWRPYENNKPPY